MPEVSPEEARLLASFAEVERVVADPVRFKLHLGIGEDAYASLRLKKNVFRLWDLVSWGGTGAAAASSKIVATTFFAPTGFAALLGFGTAVTPVGWVVAAALGSAGAWYGVTRLLGRMEGRRVETIPRFINTPIDVLGMTLLDLMGALAVRLAAIDGKIDQCEIDAIVEHFAADWGFDRPYVERAMPVLCAGAEKATIRDLARQLAIFQRENPDCNTIAMQETLLRFLRDVATSDGALDEREELAIEAIAAVMNAPLGRTSDRWRQRGSAALAAATHHAKKLAERGASIDLQPSVLRRRKT